MWHRYIHLFDEEHRGLHIQGLIFKDFFRIAKDALADRSLLLLQHQYEMAIFNPISRFFYITPEQLPELLEDDIFAYGAFSWLDLKDQNALGQVTDEEIAEILYLAHISEPLRTPHFPSLGNRFAYLSFQDGQFLRLYADSEQITRSILSGILQISAGKNAPPPPSELTDWFVTQAKRGIWLDVSQALFGLETPAQTSAIGYCEIGEWNPLTAPAPRPNQLAGTIVVTPQRWERKPQALSPNNP
jgi:hypothetical protein